MLVLGRGVVRVVSWGREQAPGGRRSALARGRFGGEAKGLREGSPSIREAFGRGSLVSVVVRSGYDVLGYVCDHDGAGLLLDLRDPSGDPSGYEFLPWSSVERVRVQDT